MNSQKKTTPRAATKKNKGHILEVLAVIMIILSLAASGLLFIMFGENAKKACTDSFSKAYEDTKKNTYDQFKKKAFDFFEAQNHVSNRATITIGNIKEENSLEVLTVSDSWIKMSDPDNDEDKTTRWVEFSATGVYIIDMSASEFIIDDYNNYIIVKLKTPQLSHVALDADTKAYLYKYNKGFFELNGDYDSGVTMLLNDRAEALDKLTEQLESNDSNLARAKTSAEYFIRSFIKTVNPGLDIKDSNIQIQFT